MVHFEKLEVCRTYRGSWQVRRAPTLLRKSADSGKTKSLFELPKKSSNVGRNNYFQSFMERG